MEEIRILIIEDEKPAARSLNRKLEGLGYPVMDMLHSVKQTKQWFTENKHPDLIFLDIQLSDGLSFEIFEDIEIKSAIIFTTAYDDYAIKAFKLNSIDYLLKPVAEEELVFALEKFKEWHTQRPALDYQELKKLLTGGETNYRERLSIKVGQNIKILTVKDIVCFFSENKGTYAYTAANDTYLLDQTLEELENTLDPHTFFRISRRYIINIHCIKQIHVHSTSRLRIQLQHYPGTEVIVSRERVGDFKKWLG